MAAGKKTAAIHQTYGETTKDLQKRHKMAEVKITFKQNRVESGDLRLPNEIRDELLNEGSSACLYPCYYSLYPQYM